MIARAKKYLVGLTVLVILAVGLLEDAKSDYVESVTPDVEQTGQYRVEESSKEEIGNGIAYASEEDNYIFCAADAWTWATGDSAYLERHGYGYLTYAWTWQCPPSTPPGGTLSWEIDGDGDSVVDGSNLDGSYVDAFNFGGAASGVMGYSSFPDTLSKAGGRAIGLVDGDDMAVSIVDTEGTYPPYIQDEPNEGFYHCAVQWNSLDYDEDTIPVGTAYFYFEGIAQCICESLAEAGSGSISHADTSTDATVDIYVDFDPNSHA